MAVGLQKLVRRSILAKLKNDASLTALVPAEQINPDGVPDWPFIKLNASTTQPMRMACVVGGLVTWDIHAFARAREDGGAVVETAEDHAGSIGAAIEQALNYDHLALEGGGDARVRLSDIRLLPDGDEDSYHWFAQINARVLAE